MSTTALYEVIDKLVTGFATATTLPVFDGYPPTDDPGPTYVAVGVPDPTDQDAASSGSATQDWQEVGSRTRNEAGTVSCCIVATDGDGDQKTARDTAMGVADDLAEWLRSNYTLNLAQVLWAGYGADTTLMQDLTETGAIALVTFTVAYRAYLTA